MVSLSNQERIERDRQPCAPVGHRLLSSSPLPPSCLLSTLFVDLLSFLPSPLFVERPSLER